MIQYLRLPIVEKCTWPLRTWTSLSNCKLSNIRRSTTNTQQISSITDRSFNETADGYEFLNIYARHLFNIFSFKLGMKWSIPTSVNKNYQYLYTMLSISQTTESRVTKQNILRKCNEQRKSANNIKAVDTNIVQTEKWQFLRGRFLSSLIRRLSY